MNENQAPNQEAPKQLTPQEQFIELVKNLAPDTSSRLKARLLPPAVGIMFVIGPFVFRVGYINPGKLQFSSDFYGLKVENGILRPGGVVEQEPKAPPKPHEVGRNPANVTLDVKSSSVQADAIFGARGANGQTQAE